MTALRVVEGARQITAGDTDAAGVNHRMIAALRSVGLHPRYDVEGHAIVEFDIAVPELDDRARSDLLERVEQSLRPSAREVLGAEIAMLVAACMPRADADQLAQVLTYDLHEYPSDVLRQAFKEQRRANKHLPTVAEMTGRCEPLVSPRRAARDALQPDAIYSSWERWPHRVGLWVKSKYWNGFWGPPPGEPHCQAPKGLLRRYGIETRRSPPPMSEQEMEEDMERRKREIDEIKIKQGLKPNLGDPCFWDG